MFVHAEAPRVDMENEGQSSLLLLVSCWTRCQRGAGRTGAQGPSGLLDLSVSSSPHGNGRSMENGCIAALCPHPKLQIQRPPPPLTVSPLPHQRSRLFSYCCRKLRQGPSSGHCFHQRELPGVVG